MNLINPFLKIGKILENTIFMACNPHTIKFYKILKIGPKVDTAKKKQKKPTPYVSHTKVWYMWT